MKKNYKLIISDFDGTLAGKNEIVSPKVALSVKKWIETGHDFSIATGKNYYRIKRNVENLGLKTPQIVQGGAEIIDPKTQKTIYSQLIDKETVSDFIQFIMQNKYDVIVDDGHTYYSSYDYQSGNPFIKHARLEEFKLRPVPKIVVRINDEDVLETEKFLEKVVKKKYPRLNIYKSYNPLRRVWDVTSLSATKNLGVLELIKMMGFDRHEVVGVGDGHNDFPLLEACGFKVAMENAPEELKAIADLVVPSYEEDGMVVLIEHLLSDN